MHYIESEFRTNTAIDLEMILKTIKDQIRFAMNDLGG